MLIRIVVYLIVCSVLVVLTIKKDRKWKGHTTVTDLFMTTLFAFIPPINLCFVWMIVKDWEIPQKIAKFGSKKVF